LSFSFPFHSFFPDLRDYAVFFWLLHADDQTVLVLVFVSATQLANR